MRTQNTTQPYRMLARLLGSSLATLLGLTTLIHCGGSDRGTFSASGGTGGAGGAGSSTGTTGCAATGDACTVAADCCNQLCFQGQCVATPADCKIPGAACVDPGECCTGRCEPETGTGNVQCLGFCLDDGQPCDKALDCCNLGCHNGACGGPQCF